MASKYHLLVYLSILHLPQTTLVITRICRRLCTFLHNDSNFTYSHIEKEIQHIDISIVKQMDF